MYNARRRFDKVKIFLVTFLYIQKTTNKQTGSDKNMYLNNTRLKNIVDTYLQLHIQIFIQMVILEFIFIRAASSLVTLELHSFFSVQNFHLSDLQPPLQPDRLYFFPPVLDDGLNQLFST